MAALVGCGPKTTESSVSQVTVAAAPSTAGTAGTVDTTPAAPTSAQPRREVVEAKKPVIDTDGGPTTEEARLPQPARIPEVLLTSSHSALCRVRAGDQMPALTLPQLSGGATELAKLYGKRATVVLFWGDDPWMSETALKDLADIGALDNVAVVGIAVKLASSEVQAAVEKTGADFPQFLDSDGQAFNQVGMTKLPRVYVLNEAGEIVWFDIEYSQSSARELKQTLAVLAAGN